MKSPFGFIYISAGKPGTGFYEVPGALRKEYLPARYRSHYICQEMIFRLFILLLLLMPSGAVGNELYSIPIRKAEGLPSNSVYSVLQDSKGFIWLATDEGLCRYDGFEFKTYRSDGQVSLPGSAVKEDKLGRIWYQNFDGYIYYVSGDTLATLAGEDGPGLFPYCITDKYVSVARQGAIAVYDIKSLRRVKTVAANDFYHAAATGDKAWYGTGDEIVSIDNALGVQRVGLSSMQKQSMRQLWVGNNELYVTTKKNESRILQIFTGSELKRSIPIPEPDIIQGFAIIDSTYWVLTPDGAFAYNEAGRVLNGGQPYLKGKSVSGVLKDKRGNYWFITTNDGIHLVPEIGRELLLIAGFTPGSLLAFGSELSVGTREGAVLTYNNTSGFRSSPIKGKSEVGYIYRDSQMRLAISRFAIVENIATGKLKEYQWAIKQVCRLDDKYYAVATSNMAALMCFDFRAFNTRSVWDNVPGEPMGTTDDVVVKPFAQLRCKSVAVSGDVLYYATNAGLFRVTPVAGWKEVTTGTEHFYAQWLLSYQHFVFALDTRGALHRIENGKFTRLSSQNGLPGETIVKIKLCGDHLFAQTNDGLYHATPGDGNIRFSRTSIDTRGDGINDFEVYEGKLLLATDAGIIVSNLPSASDMLRPPDLRINSVKVNGREIERNGRVSLKYNENKIVIHYSILDYVHATGTTLYYKVNNGEWSAISDKIRSLEFRSLAPGDYTILFSYKPGGDVLDRVQFTIDSPFWQKWWFLLACALCVGVLIYLLYRNRLKSIMRKNRQQLERAALEQELSRSMLTSIKAQMNPHFFYNALNTIQGYIFTNDRKNASNYLAKFSRLTRMILEMSGKERISLSEEIRSLTLYLELEKMRFDEEFVFVIDIAAGVDTELVRIPPMIIQPYVENAIKHGLLHKAGERQLSIAISSSTELLRVEIEDNGIGRKRSAEINKHQNSHTPFSVEANKKRIELLNKAAGNKVSVEIIDKADAGGEPLGTKVVLVIPSK